MRIVFVAPYPLSCIRIRSYGFVTQLAKKHEVTVLALCSNQREVIDVQNLKSEGINLIAVTDKFHWKLLRVLCALSSKQPLQVAFDASSALRDVLSQQLAWGHFDLLHVEFIRALGMLPEVLPIPVVWDAVDCISQLYTYGAQYGATPLLRLVGKIEAKRTREYEYMQLWRFSDVLVTSERDRQALLAIASNGKSMPTNQTRARITVLPHGIDQQYFQPYVGERHPETLIFSGKMSFHANIAGAMHLVEQIMPIIWQQRPDVRVIIAGSNPPSKIRRLALEPRIEVTGYVADLRLLIAQAKIAVCPLPYAVGIQNKILEAMALGTPIVASSHAAAGLQATDDQDILIADQPKTFASAVLRLLDDQTLWEKLSKNGLAYIATHHNWEHIIDQLNEIYAHAINNYRPTSLSLA